MSFDKVTYAQEPHTLTSKIHTLHHLDMHKTRLLEKNFSCNNWTHNNPHILKLPLLRPLHLRLPTCSQLGQLVQPPGAGAQNSRHLKHNSGQRDSFKRVFLSGLPQEGSIAQN